MAYERAQVSILLDRLEEAPERLIVVTGPRQTGKTTLVRQALGRAGLPHRYLPVDEPEPVTLPPFPRDREDTFALSNDATIPIDGEKDARWLVRQWERARMDADRSERVFVLAFDEVQKIPGWSEAVKGLWDADRRDGRRLHVVLLGSAPLLMQRGMSESLAGRYETIRVPHWSFSEMSAAFDFDLPGYVYFGGYPGAAPLVREQDRWRAYVTEALVEPNIERDILAMQRVDKPSLLKRLFELGAEYSGQILSYNKMLGQLQDAGNTTTLARYLDLLGNLAGDRDQPSFTRRSASSVEPAIRYAWPKPLTKTPRRGTRANIRKSASGRMRPITSPNLRSKRSMTTFQRALPRSTCPAAHSNTRRRRAKSWAASDSSSMRRTLALPFAARWPVCRERSLTQMKKALSLRVRTNGA